MKSVGIPRFGDENSAVDRFGLVQPAGDVELHGIVDVVAMHKIRTGSFGFFELWF
jgi:hypothetical protein